MECIKDKSGSLEKSCVIKAMTFISTCGVDRYQENMAEKDG